MKGFNSMHNSNTFDISTIIALLVDNGFTSEQIVTSDHYCTNTTYQPTQAVYVIVKPSPIEATSGGTRYNQLITLINLAKEHSFSIHPVSKGLNLGYGGFEPFDDSIVVDLSNFNRISNYDEATGQITVEPGVTQEDICQFLKENGDIFIHDTTGAPKQASIIGNYLERGFGHTSMAEHPKNILHAQIIIPLAKHQQAALFLTAMDGAINTLDNIRTFNVGPDSTGLIIQNNIGLVTSLTIKLLHNPDMFVAYFIPFKSNVAKKMIDTCAQLRAQGTIHSAAHIGNNIKTLQLLAVEYPELIETYNPQKLQNLVSALSLDDWTLSGGLYGTSAQIRAHIKDLKKLTKPLSLKPIFVGPRKQNILKVVERYVDKYEHKIKKSIHSKHPIIRQLAAKLLMIPGLNALCSIKQGAPSNYFLKSVYWRNLNKRNIRELSPERDNIGLLWGAPCSSINGDDFHAITELMHRKCEQYSLECPISVTLLNSRTMECVLSLSFDRDNDEEAKNAMQCYKEIMLQTAEMGFVQYRMSTFANSFLEHKHLSLSEPLLDIKGFLDPCNVISPQKYRLLSDNFTEESQEKYKLN